MEAVRDIKKQLQKVTYLIEKDYAVLHLFNLNWINFASILWDADWKLWETSQCHLILGKRIKSLKIFYCDLEDFSVIEENCEETEEDPLLAFSNLN